MAEGADPEWLLWCKRLKLEHAKFEHQITNLTQTTSQIETSVANENALTASKIEQIEAESKTFKDRIAGLEKNLHQHNESNSDNSSLFDKLRAENKLLTEQILQLEQEARDQDQINIVNSQEKATLEQQFKTLKLDFSSVTNAVGNMQKTVRMEREGQKNDLEDMQARVEALVASALQRDDSSAHKDPRGSAGGLSPNPTRSRWGTSQAVASDKVTPKEANWIHNTTQPKSQLAGSTQLHTQYLDSTQLDIAASKPSINGQGSLSLKDYIRHADTVLTEGIQRYEASFVSDFVSGLNDGYRQRLLHERLQESGWTWSKAQEGMQKLAKEGERSRKRRRMLSPDFV